MTPFWDDRVAGWVAARIPGCERGFGPCKAMGVVSKGKIVAGLVFHNWQPEHGLIEISGAAEDRRWMTRRVMAEALGYAFDQVGCQMIVAQQDLANEAPRKAWLALGASEYIIPRLRGRDRDGSIVTLTAEQWQVSKFNKPSEVKYGKIKRARAS